MPDDLLAVPEVVEADIPKKPWYIPWIQFSFYVIAGIYVFFPDPIPGPIDDTVVSLITFLVNWGLGRIKR